MSEPTYGLHPSPAEHSCWDDPQWDGTLSKEGACKGCDQAVVYPCRYCGYGRAFTTHNPEAHVENGDEFATSDAPDEWVDAPHLYLEKESQSS